MFNFNVAYTQDFIDLVSIDTEDAEQAHIDCERIDEIHTAFMNSKNHIVYKHKPEIILPSNRKQFPFQPLRTIKRLGALFRRAWRQNIRDFQLNIIRFITSIGLPILFSQIFANVEKGVPMASSIADRPALLSYAVINMSMVSKF